MKAYLTTYKFYYDNKLMSIRCNTQLQESPYEDEISGTDFDGLWDLTSKWCAMIPLNMWEFKKGKRFLADYDYGLFGRNITPKNCKPWKFTITSEETTISMNRLMSFKSEDVIQYLKERGITTCPMNF